MTGPALTVREISPTVSVVAQLNPDKILQAKMSLSNDTCICLKAGSCNKSAALPGSTSTLCTSKLLMHKVRTSASWCRLITLDGLMGGKDMGLSTGCISFAVIRGTDGIYSGSNCGCLQQLFPLTTRPALVFSWASQYVVDGRLGLKREF